MVVRNYAMIKDGIVENIIVADDNFKLDGYILQDIGSQTVAIGDMWDGNKFVKFEPEPVTPEPSTEEILLQALLEIQHLKQKITELEGE